MSSQLIHIEPTVTQFTRPESTFPTDQPELRFTPYRTKCRCSVFNYFFNAATVLQWVSDRAPPQRASPAALIHRMSLAASRVFHGSFPSPQLPVPHTQRGGAEPSTPTQRRDSSCAFYFHLFYSSSPLGVFQPPHRNRAAADEAAILPGLSAAVALSCRGPATVPSAPGARFHPERSPLRLPLAAGRGRLPAAFPRSRSATPPVPPPPRLRERPGLRPPSRPVPPHLRAGPAGGSAGCPGTAPPPPAAAPAPGPAPPPPTCPPRAPRRGSRSKRRVPGPRPPGAARGAAAAPPAPATPARTPCPRCSSRRLHRAGPRPPAPGPASSPRRRPRGPARPPPSLPGRGGTAPALAERFKPARLCQRPRRPVPPPRAAHWPLRGPACLHSPRAAPAPPPHWYSAGARPECVTLRDRRAGANRERARARGQRGDWRGGGRAPARWPMARRGHHVHSLWVNRERGGAGGGALTPHPFTPRRDGALGARGGGSGVLPLLRPRLWSLPASPALWESRVPLVTPR